MKKNKIASFFLIFVLFALTVSCNKDKDPNNDANTGQNGGGGSSNTGVPFTYDFTITGGQYDGHYSGKCKNESSISSTNAYYVGNNPEVFVASMSSDKTNELSILGTFIHYTSGTVTDFDDKDDPSGVNITFSDDSTYADVYTSVSGTAKISNIKRYLSVFASYKAKFDGTFNNSKDGDVHIKGTITTELPAD